MTQRRILVTSALPYANGPIHLGHLVEYLQTDIWVRFQKLRGHNCRYMCADDTHGTAIMIQARQEGRKEEDLIAETKVAHERDFADFDIEFDNYGSTHSEENRALCAEIWQSIRKAGLVKEADVEQPYDAEADIFLADRFVRGTCPKCGAKDQPGDNCSTCGHHYSPIDLIDPKSTLSGATPEVRSAKHLFIELEQLHEFLQDWTQSGDHLQPEIANYLKGHFLCDPLRDWDISRPAPYFGFEIPDSPGNFWYVWFDAPIGYIASTREWCDRTGEDFDAWWKSTETEIHHFIGKDITYFHALFWPGMLKTAGYNLPTKLHVHGFLTVGGEEPEVTHPRNLIVAETNSQATIVETYAGVGGGEAYLTNAVTEVVANENATLVHYKIERECEQAFHVATTNYHQYRSSNVTFLNVVLGGTLVRNDIYAMMDGEGCDCSLNGLSMLSGSQHADNHLWVHHAKPHCDSREYFKGIYDDQSHGVFCGRIFVEEGAQKTDAKQTNMNLILSDEALADSKPQLEIFADDVKCTHGATIGQIDNDAIFYLGTRGLSKEAARSMLIYAFANEMISQISIEPLRARLSELLFDRLPQTEMLRETV